MDIPSPLTITWTKLLSLAQDWRSTVHQMQVKAKGSRWKKSRARLEMKQKMSHMPGNYTPVSKFTYQTSITLAQQQPQTAHRQRQIQLKKHMAHTEFLTGTAEDPDYDYNSKPRDPANRLKNDGDKQQTVHQFKSD